MSAGLRWGGRGLLLAGGLVMALGVVMAARTLAGVYEGVLADPLAEQAARDEPERAAAARVLVWAAVGAAGLPLAVVGLVMTRVGRRTARLRSGRGRTR